MSRADALRGRRERPNSRGQCRRRNAVRCTSWGSESLLRKLPIRGPFDFGELSPAGRPFPCDWGPVAMGSHKGRPAAISPAEVARRLMREGIACANGGVSLEEQAQGQDGIRVTGQREKPRASGSASVMPVAESAAESSAERNTKPDADGSADRRFTVTVFDLEATDVRRLYPANHGLSMRRGPAEPDDRLRRIVSRAAIRTLYVLGLPFGQVEVSTNEAGKPAIVFISKKMNPSAGEGAWRTRQAMDGHFAMLAGESGRRAEAVLGADPEFVLQSPDGKVVPASRYLPPGGVAGCDSVVRRGVRVWPLVELRPEPAAEPAVLVASMRQLLLLAARRIASEGGTSLRWRAGAWPVPGLPLGGHIHISGVALTGQLLRALDNAVALPLRLLEPPGAAGRRPRYGALGDFRRQPHGGFEYRTPPSWLTSRKLAQGVLALAKLAAEHAGELAGCRPLDDDAMRDAFYAAAAEGGTGQEALREATLAVCSELRRLSGYRRYAADVDSVFEAIRARRHWDESADFRRKWGIPGGSSPPVK